MLRMGGGQNIEMIDENLSGEPNKLGPKAALEHAATSSFRGD